MSALTPIPLTRLTGFPGAGKTMRPEFLFYQPALAKDIFERAFARPCALEAVEARV